MRAKDSCTRGNVNAMLRQRSAAEDCLPSDWRIRRCVGVGCLVEYVSALL